MTFATAFVSVLSVFSNSNLYRPRVTSETSSHPEPRKVIVTCSNKWPCPEGSRCMKVMGKEGFCILEKEV